MAARIVTLRNTRDSITPILEELHLLPVEKRIEFKILAITFRIIHGTAPDYLSELLCQKSSPRCLRSSSKILLKVPKSRTKMYGDRAFSIIAPKLWNALPVSIQTENSIDVFRKKLKTYLFRQAYCT